MNWSSVWSQLGKDHQELQCLVCLSSHLLNIPLYFPNVIEGSTLKCPLLPSIHLLRRALSSAARWRAFQQFMKMNGRLALCGGTWSWQFVLLCAAYWPRFGGTERSSTFSVLVLHGAGKLSLFPPFLHGVLSLEAETRCRAECMNAIRESWLDEENASQCRASNSF